jgi:multiple antibiotic resistance protein
MGGAFFGRRTAMPDPTTPITLAGILSGWLITVAAIFPLANPLEAIPMFLEVTAKQTKPQRARQMLRACVFAGLLMAGSLLLGRVLLRLVGVSAPAVLGAGGLIVVGLGFRMLITGKAGLPAEERSRTDHDYSLIPLAFPGVCGPGAIAALISGSAYIQRLGSPKQVLVGYGVALAGITTVCIAAWIILRLSGPIARWLGRDGLDAMCRFLGMLLIVIGVQLLADGVSGLVAAARSSGPPSSIPVVGGGGT